MLGELNLELTNELIQRLIGYHVEIPLLDQDKKYGDPNCPGIFIYSVDAIKMNHITNMVVRHGTRRSITLARKRLHYPNLNDAFADIVLNTKPDQVVGIYGVYGEDNTSPLSVRLGRCNINYRDCLENILTFEKIQNSVDDYIRRINE